jgi:hypothetical protein
VKCAGGQNLNGLDFRSSLDPAGREAGYVLAATRTVSRPRGFMAPIPILCYPLSLLHGRAPAAKQP